MGSLGFLVLLRGFGVWKLGFRVSRVSEALGV